MVDDLNTKISILQKDKLEILESIEKLDKIGQDVF